MQFPTRIRRILRTRSVRGGLLLTVCASVLAALLSRGAAISDAAVICEIPLIATGLLLLCSFRSVRNSLRSLPTAKRYGLACVLCLMIAGHLAGDSRRWFPFVRWDMYGNVAVTENVPIARYVGVTETGERVRVNPAGLYPLLGGGSLRLCNRLEELHRCGYGSVPAPLNQPFQQRLKRTLAVIARKHNDTHPRERIVRLELWLNRVNVLEDGNRESFGQCVLAVEPGA